MDVLRFWAILSLISVPHRCTFPTAGVIILWVRFDVSLSIHAGFALSYGAIDVGTAFGYVLHEYQILLPQDTCSPYFSHSGLFFDQKKKSPD